MRTLASSAFVAALTLLVAGPAAAQQLGPATAAGLNADSAAAARRVMMNALQHGGNHGGCAPLPRGWAVLNATVRLPASYGGYGAWVNIAELLPASENLAGFLKSHSGGPFYRTASGSERSVHTVLCAPAGFTYWLVIDSGSAKVAVGRVTLQRPGRTYRVVLTAPPFGRAERTPAPAPSAAARPPVELARYMRAHIVALPTYGMTAMQITPRFLYLVHASPTMHALRGIVIVDVGNGGWAAAQGFRSLDVVTAVDGESVETIGDFERL
ncbi:MAG: hypothetical protein ACYC0H_20945, partial [Solirubrobacteraceae bacterium]